MDLIIVAGALYRAMVVVYAPKLSKIIKDTKRLLGSDTEITNAALLREHAALSCELANLEQSLPMVTALNVKDENFAAWRRIKKHRELLNRAVELRNSVTEYSQRADPFTLKYEEAAQNPSHEEFAEIALPLAPAAAPPLYEELEAVRALFDLMPRRYTGDRHITARMAGQPNMALVEFPSADDALAFQNNWNAKPPVGFKCVKALLARDYTLDLEPLEEDIGLANQSSRAGPRY
ncbi:hypothetical protein MVEN_00690800 [Mycena venus]|uniref:Uncharacterized protein n=1 Tax=Mycena venus TaxID=2733690 RepID=A0A8H7D533_9AGAR|nr:hypothetical protein MVEN_00690800 [Mycena venus]